MIVGSFNKITSQKNSHSYGWARTWSENLGVGIDHDNGKHKNAYLLHGANFGGSLNFFGGFTDDHKKWINNLLEAESITSLDQPCPEYGSLLAKRKDVVDKEWCNAIDQKLKEAKTLIGSDLDTDALAVGDSHTAAYAPWGAGVVKQDGTTLFGQVKTDFEYIKHHIKPNHKKVTISLGNIDIRHHVCRHDFQSFEKLVEVYVKFLKELETRGRYVEVGLLWPIEFEGRKLPKTGFYKGTPFYGSREDRMKYRNYFNKTLKDSGLNVVGAPEDWEYIDPETYAKTRMERVQSVHLSPEYYRRKDWGATGLEAFFG